jgi:hypothetical protein
VTTLLFAGPAAEIFFLLITPFLAIALGYFGAYTAHSLFVVIEQTAAGFDRVCWPQEGFLDWFGKLLHFLLVLLVVVGAGAVLFIAADVYGGGMSLSWMCFIGYLLVWLVLPVFLLSSLSGTTPVAVLRWDVIKGLARCWAPLLAFYALTALPLLLSAGGLYFVVWGWREVIASVITPGWDDIIASGSLLPGLIIAAMIAGTSVLLYARLLGRLAWMLQIIEKDEPEEETEPEAPAPAAAPETAAPVAVLPAAVAVPATTGETYAMVDEPPPPEPPAQVPFRWEPGRMPSPPPPKSEWRDLPGRAEAPADLRKEKPEPFVRPRVAALLEPKVFLFPWYRTSLWAWAYLVVGILLLATLLRLPVGYL